ncbi:hypothetical protein Pmani_036504 [Petrolisthes manimaculis]|uniref:Uncharacterized protein n=1 Tax=Petrolisthes manimaculis TaxID=1843537 RepID=A0AAE1NJH4_9EUCA|nr:hypothetical protein Pmani_036504 [Petrolisthes manimaculis]
MEDQINHSTPSVLAVARQNLDILSTHGESVTLTYWDIVRSILDLFRTSLSAQDVLKALELGWEALRMKNELSTRTMSMKRLILARSATLCMAQQGVRVTGLWEDALQVVINHVRRGDPIFIKNVFTSYPLKQWILSVFSDADLCPNYNIRLDLLTIISTWEQLEANDGKSVLLGLMQLSVYLDAEEHLVPNTGVPSLEVSWFSVMYTVDQILKVVITCPRLQSLVSTLRRDHGDDLDRISQHTYRMGIPLQFLPESIDEDTTINCPQSIYPASRPTYLHFHFSPYFHFHSHTTYNPTLPPPTHRTSTSTSTLTPLTTPHFHLQHSVPLHPFPLIHHLQPHTSISNTAYLYIHFHSHTTYNPTLPSPTQRTSTSTSTLTPLTTPHFHLQHTHTAPNRLYDLRAWPTWVECNFFALYC